MDNSQQTNRIIKEATGLIMGRYLWASVLALVVILALSLAVSWWFLPIGLVVYVAVIYALASGRTTLPQSSMQTAPVLRTPSLDTSALSGQYLASVQRAQNVSNEIARTIAGTSDPGLRTALNDSTHDLPELVRSIYDLAVKSQRLDTAMQTTGSMEALSAEVMRLDNARKTTNDPFQRDQYAAALDGKLQQMQNFTDTRVALERWTSQIDNALSALDTLFSQVLRIQSSEVLSYSSSATDQLSRTLANEVASLKATSDAFDSVYKTT